MPDVHLRRALFIALAGSLAAISAAFVYLEIARPAITAGSTLAGSPRSYIVMLDGSVKHPEAFSRRDAGRYGARLTHVYTHAIKGYSAFMSPQAARSIEREPGVVSVGADEEMVPQGWTSFVPSGPQLVGGQLHRIFAADRYSVACEGKGTPDPKVNQKIGINCVDDARVDVDVAVLDTGMDNSADLNVVSRVDCVHPAFPYREPGATYIPPPLPEDPEYSLWHPDVALNEEAESSEYGCLENDGPTPIAAYSFDEGSGTTLHDSAGSHDGTIEGATWTSEGKYGSALQFDGEDDLVSIPNSAGLNLTGSFTLEAWVRRSPSSSVQPVISKSEGALGSTISGYTLFSRSQKDEPRGGVASSGASASVEAEEDPLPTDGTWSHLALTSDTQTLRLYVDGELVATKSAFAAGSTPGADLEIGHFAPLYSYFDGTVDEVRIYDEALNQAQIQGDRDETFALPAA